MGKTESKIAVSNTTEQTYINRSQLELLNQNITENISNSYYEIGQHCGSSATGAQEVIIKNIYAEQDFNYDGTSEMFVTLNFNCMQASEIRQAVANDLFKEIFENLQSSNSVDVLTKLDTDAKLNMEEGFGSSWGSWGEKDISNDQQITYHVENDNYKNIQNVIMNTIENNFTSKDVKTCTSSVGGTQTTVIEDVYAGNNVNIKITQRMALESMTSCTQQQNTANDITNVMAEAMGIEIIEDTQTTASTEGSLTSDISIISTGPIQDLGNAISSIIDSVFSGYVASLSMICLICVVVMIVIGMLLYGATQFIPEEERAEIGKSISGNIKGVTNSASLLSGLK